MIALPFFKFTVNEWITGDITLEDYYEQGLFISLCAYYWSKEGKLSLATAKKKFKDAKPGAFDLLFKIKVMHLDEDENIIISFLDQQFDEMENRSNQNSKNGKKGGRPRKVTAPDLMDIAKKQVLENEETENKPDGSFIETEKKQYREDKIREDKIREEKTKGDLSEKADQVLKALIEDLGFSESRYYPNQRILMQFVRVMESRGELENFIEQYVNYKAYKKASAEKSHKWSSLIGSPEEQFNDGLWNSENWKHKLDTLTSGKPVSKAKATAGTFSSLKK